MDQQKPTERWSEIDGIRGFAASVVVLYHFLLFSADTLPGWVPWVFAYSPLYLFITGFESVLMFFLISGFVLSLPYHRNPNHLDYVPFLIRRVARIYLPYLGALFLAVLGNSFFHGLKLNDWFAQTWSHPVDPGTVVQHILFLGNYNYSAFNNAFSTLIFEMRISLIFPMLCIGVIRLGYIWSLIIGIGSAILSVVLTRIGVPFETSCTFRIVTIFIVGILLARLLLAHREDLLKLPAHLRVGGLIVSLVFYISAHLVPSPARDVLTLLGACGIIISAMIVTSFSKILRWPVFQFLGRISYSVYLLHITILFVLAYTLHQWIPRPLLFIPFVVCVLVLSTLFYHVVINPSIELGRRVSKRFSSKTKTSRSVPAEADVAQAGSTSGSGFILPNPENPQP